MIQTKKKRRTRIIAIGCVAVTAAAVLMWATAAKDAPPEETAAQILVNVQSPETGDIVLTGEYIGAVEPNQQVKVFPKAAGEVLSVSFNVGDVVKEGDVLCVLDSKALETSIAQTEAALASAQAKANHGLSMAQYGLDTAVYNQESNYDGDLLRAESSVTTAKQGLEAAENGLLSARTALNYYRTDLREFRDEYGIGANDEYSPGDYSSWPYDLVAMYEAKRQSVKSAEIALTNAENAVETAKRGLETAQDSLKATQKGKEQYLVTAEGQVTTAELNANLKEQYIMLNKLKDDLTEYAVKAPISGVIEQKNVSEFDMASQQSPVYVISNKDAMTVSFKVPEAALAHIRLGNEIIVEKNGEQCKGVITEVATMADAASGLFTAKANVERASFPMHTGSTIKILTVNQKAENAILIPVDALYYENGSPYVYTATGGIAHKTFVQTGIFDDKNIEIVSGLSLGDPVITTWNANLEDGAVITPAMTEQPLPEGGEENSK